MDQPGVVEGVFAGGVVDAADYGAVGVEETLRVGRVGPRSSLLG